MIDSTPYDTIGMDSDVKHISSSKPSHNFPQNTIGGAVKSSFVYKHVMNSCNSIYSIVRKCKILVPTPGIEPGPPT